MPSISRADLYEFADAIQRKTVQAANSAPFTSSLERLADAISKVEPSALSSAFGKISDLIQKARTRVKDKRLERRTHPARPAGHESPRPQALCRRSLTKAILPTPLGRYD